MSCVFAVSIRAVNGTPKCFLDGLPLVLEGGFPIGENTLGGDLYAPVIEEVVGKQVKDVRVTSNNGRLKIT